ncbi:VacJ family lipoprotein [Vibrio sp.]|nr:VacJ family lipoprotein [Vibrio sp.]
MSIGVSKYILILFFNSMLIGCSSAPDESDVQDSPSNNESELIVDNEETFSDEDQHFNDDEVSDPLEGFNRAMWDLNYEYLDPYFVRPVSLAYVGYVPQPIRTGILNFWSNLDEPFSMVNNAVMGNGQKAADHMMRFLVNTTFGLLGFIDVASETGITRRDDKSFGDALGHYGVGNGPYVMLPGLGPKTTRDAGDYVDGTYPVLSYLNFWMSAAKFAFEGMESRAAVVNQEAMLHNSPDPYILVRDAYIQHQDFKAEIEVEETYNEDEEDLYDEFLDDEFGDEAF